MQLKEAEGITDPMLHFTLRPANAETVYLGWINPRVFPTNMEFSLAVNAAKKDFQAVNLYRGDVSASFFGIDPKTVGLSVGLQNGVNLIDFPAAEFFAAFEEAVG